MVVAPEGGAPGRNRIGVICRGSWTARHGRNIAGEPRDDLTFDAAVADFSAPRPGDAPMQVRKAGGAIRAIQIAGAARRTLELTARYSSERRQFGRPITRFQALQGNLAVIATETAATTAAGDAAAAAFDQGLPDFAIAAAQARASKAASIIAALGHQVHGAMGFTSEYRLHRLTRRLWSWRDEFGSEAEWNRMNGRAIAAAGADHIWATLSAG